MLLAGSFRNVALVWAATAHVLSPESNLLLELTALPIFAIPALARAALAWRNRAWSPRASIGRQRRSASLLRAWLPAAPLLLAMAGFTRGETPWHHTDLERDSRTFLADAVPGGDVGALATHPQEPGAGDSGDVACGTVRRAGGAAILAVFDVATEQSVGLVRAGRPILRGWSNRTTAASEILGAFCQHASPSGTTVAASVTSTHALSR